MDNVNIILIDLVCDLLSSNYYCVILLRLLLAPIAQQVERIHGKDEVSGSNPDGGSRIPGLSHDVETVFLFDISFRIAQKIFDHAPEYGKQYGYAVLTAAFFAVVTSKIRQTIRL